MPKQNFQWKSSVRDYELDSQGIVNNATYVNYLEQCRNDYIRTLDIDLKEFLQLGYNLVVAATHVKYLAPLQSKDAFYVTAEISKLDGKRLYFQQEIRMQDGDALIAVAEVKCACVSRETGKSCMPDILTSKLPVIK